MWGRSGEVYEQEAVDQKDPNYDEAQVLTLVFGAFGKPHNVQYM